MGDKMSGIGIYKFTNCDIYHGQFEENQKCGFGEYKYNYDEKRIEELKKTDENAGTVQEFYKGQFKDDKMDGIGKIHFNNGDTYEGYFKNGVPHYQGTYIYRNN